MSPLRDEASVSAFAAADTVDRLRQSVGAMVLLHSSNQAVIEASIGPPGAPWYDALDAQLGAAEDLVVGWRRSGFLYFQQNVLAEAVACGQVFLSAQAEIDAAFGEMEQTGVSTARQRILGLMSRLDTPVSQLVSSLDRCLTRLQGYQRAMGTSHDLMTTTVAQVQAKEVDLETRISAINDTINGLRTQIVTDRKAIAEAGKKRTAGIVETIFGIVLAPLSGGASLVLAAIGVGTIAEAQEQVDHLQSALAQAQSVVVSEQSELADDERQVAVLQGVMVSVGMVLQDLEYISQSLDALRVAWSVLQAELGRATRDVQEATTTSQALTARVWYDAACRSWREIVDFAEQFSTANPPTPRRLVIGS